MSLWDRIRGKKPSRIKPPAPPRSTARPYGDEGVVIKTPEQYLRDGGDRDRPRRKAADYDRTVDSLRRDREQLARDNDRLRRDRDDAWSGYPVGYAYPTGDDMYHGPNVVDLTEGHHHHHHHEPEEIVVEHHHHYDQDDDHRSHMEEDHEADQSAFDSQQAWSAPDPTPAPDTSSSWDGGNDSSSGYSGGYDGGGGSSSDSGNYGGGE